jgi:hypothetical protein
VIGGEEQLYIERIWRKDGSGELGTDPTGKKDRDISGE